MRISALLVLLTGALVSFGCSDVVVDPDGTGGSGGSGGAAGDAGNGGLSVVQVTPADMAADVATDTEVTAELDAALNEATVTSTSFSLARDGGDEVPGTLSVDGATATLTPDGLLRPLGDYTATLTTEIEAVSGATLAMNETWSFTTRDGEWGEARLIEISNAGSAEAPQVAFGPNGDAFAVWYQSDGTDFNIWSNRFTPDAGWGAAELIETDDTDSAFTPHVAVDSEGNAIAVWRQSDGTRFNIWANRFTPSGGWGAPELLESDNAGNALTPRVAIDADGNALAVWYQTDGTRNNIWSNRFTPSGGWDTAELIETNNAGSASGPRIAFDADGNAVAVWQQSDGTRNNIWSNRFTPSGGWGAAELIENDNVGSASIPDVAVDPAGNALAVWYQSDGTWFNIESNRFTPTGGWGTAELIEISNAGSAFVPRVSLDRDGNGLAVWYQWDGTRNNIWSNRYTPSEGWGTAELIETEDLGSAFNPEVAVDPEGNGFAVWYQFDGTNNNVWANRFTRSGGWGTAELLEEDDAGGAVVPTVAVGPDGRAVAAWYQSDGTRFNILANRFE